MHYINYESKYKYKLYIYDTELTPWRTFSNITLVPLLKHTIDHINHYTNLLSRSPLLSPETFFFNNAVDVVKKELFTTTIDLEWSGYRNYYATTIHVNENEAARGIQGVSNYDPKFKFMVNWTRGRTLWQISNMNYIINRGKRKEDNEFMNYRGMHSISTYIRDGFGVYDPLGMIGNSLMQSATRAIKIRYGEELILEEHDAKTANKWIKAHDKKFENRKKNNAGILVDTQFVFQLEPYTLCYVQVGSSIERYNRSYDREGTRHSGMLIYICGKHYKKYVKELKDVIKMKDDKNLYIYSVKGFSDDANEQGVNSIGRIMDKRSVDTLFFNDHIKEKVFDHIDNFLINKELYQEKGLSYKTGILFYGTPGTGKTSFATALATKYNYNLIVIDMTTFDKLDINTLTICINADDDKYIVLLEDIDTLFTSLNRDNNLDKEERKVVNKMLQFLDSSSSPSDVIFIATTNNINVLDEAITRDGRFDLKLEIGNIEESVAREMINSFSVNKKEIDEIIDICKNHDNNLINPAKLQNEIISRFKGLKVINNTMEENKNE